MIDVGRLQGFDVSYIQLTTLLWFVCLNVGICTRAIRKSGYFSKIVSDLTLYLLCYFL
jgi:hypothetical protein